MSKISNINLQRNLLAPAKDKSYLYLPWLHKRPKQKNFVLNCDAPDWKLPEYNSLYDQNLTFFFANPKIRSILVKNGVVDEDGNVDKSQQTKRGNFSGAKRYSTKYKLPPLPENSNLAVQRVIIPYRNKRQELVNPKLSKYQSAPQKRTNTATDSNYLNSRSQTMKPQSLAQIRKVKPLTKDELQQVFAKYEVKTVKPEKDGEKEELVIEERSTDCKDNKSENSSLEEEKAEEIKEETKLDSTTKKLDFDFHQEETEARETEPMVNLEEKQEEKLREDTNELKGIEVEKEIEMHDKEIELENLEQEINEMDPEVINVQETDNKEDENRGTFEFNEKENENEKGKGKGKGKEKENENEQEEMDIENSIEKEQHVEQNQEASKIDESHMSIKKNDSVEYNFSEQDENDFPVEEEGIFE